MILPIVLFLFSLAPSSPVLSSDAFYVAAPSAVLADTSQVGGITQNLISTTDLPPCIKLDPHDVYPYWTVMPPFTNVPEGCWEQYQADIAAAKARRMQAIFECILLYADPQDLCDCVIDADNRFKLDCEIAGDDFLACCGIDPVENP